MVFFVFRKLWANYMVLLVEHPYKTKAVSSGVVNFVADSLSQSVFHQLNTRNKKDKGQSIDPFSYDIFRSFKFAFIGVTFTGVVMPRFFNLIGGIFPGNSASTALKRVVVDATMFNPFFLATIMSYVMTLDYVTKVVYNGLTGAQEGNQSHVHSTDSSQPSLESHAAILADMVTGKLSKDYIPTYIRSVMFWAPISFLNYTLVPAPLHVLYGNVMGGIWSMYLSNVAFSYEEKTEKSSSEAIATTCTAGNINIDSPTSKPPSSQLSGQAFGQLSSEPSD